MASPAVDRAARLLRLLAAHGPTPASTLAAQLGLPRSSTYVLLDALEAAGLVTHGDDQRWGLGVGVFELGSAYLRQEPLERAARPLLSRLTRHRVTAHLGVLDGTDVLYLLREDPRGRRAASSPPLVTAVGVRLPAHLTASGRAVLAALPPAQLAALYPRERALADRTGDGPRSVAELRALLDEERALGWSREAGHVTPGVCSVAAVSYDHLGRPVCAISLTAAGGPAELDPLVPELRRAADALTGRLRGRRG